jgi:Ca-activated chloride channel homolog
MAHFLRPNLWLWGLLLFTLSLPAHADGLLLPHPPNQGIAPLREIPNFSIKYHRVNVEINHPLAHTQVDQVFHNASNRELEGTYLFPIPTGASLSQFAMDVDGKMTKAELLQADQARRIYEDIVRRRIDPGLLEYAGQNLFRARVYPIPAQGDKRIQLSYDQLLPTESALHTYRYTLSTEKFSATPLENVTLTVRLKTKTPLKSIYSPSHDLKITRQGEYAALVSYEASKVKPDADFELYYTTAEDPIGVSLLSYREGNQDGYFMLLGAPKVEWKQEQTAAKSMTFILDTSGSMAGDKIKQAKAALEYNLNQLSPQDSFHLISFSDTVEPFSNKPMPATSANIRKAIAHVQGLQATGGTDIDSALQNAFKHLNGPKELNMIVFLTDGDPTVGETNLNTILNKARLSNKSQARLFVFGVGFDVNIPFLDKLSQENKGSSEYVRPEENIEIKVSNLFSRISHPILANLKLGFGSASIYDLYPRELPDMFKGSQLVLVGRYRQPGPVTVSLSGLLQGQAKSFSYSGQNLSKDKTAHSFLPRLWATRKIGFLLDQIRLKGKNKELVEEVIRLSKQYGIITEYTSFLVRDDVDVRRPAASAPMMEEADGYLERSLGEAKGSWAISQSRNAQKMQQNAAPATANSYYDQAGQEQQISQVRYIGQKSFYQKKGIWQDAAVADKLPRLQIKHFSELYFALAQKPELRKILALGPELEFVYAGQLIQIGPQGKEKLTVDLQKKLQLP